MNSKKKGMNLVEYVLIAALIFIVTIFGINFLTDSLVLIFGDNNPTKMNTSNNTRIQRDP